MVISIKNSETPRGENIHFNIKFDNSIIEEAEIQFEENINDPLQAVCAILEIMSSGKTTVSPITKENDEIVFLLSELLEENTFCFCR